MDQCDMCGQDMCEACDGCGCMGNECNCEKDGPEGGADGMDSFDDEEL